jgi:hypothetical protein
MKPYRGVDVKINIFLTSALVGGGWSASLPIPLYPLERAPGTHFIGGWVVPKSGLDDMEKWKIFTLLGLELPPPGRPARSPSLYRLSLSYTTIINIVTASSNCLMNLHECTESQFKRPEPQNLSSYVYKLHLFEKQIFGFKKQHVSEQVRILRKEEFYDILMCSGVCT